MTKKAMREKARQAKTDLKAGYILVANNGGTMMKKGRLISCRRYGGYMIRNTLDDITWLFTELWDNKGIEYQKMTLEEFHEYAIASNYRVLLPY